MGAWSAKRRLGSGLQLNLHHHTLVFDGVFNTIANWVLDRVL
jgi:hypothetical protein